MDIDWIVTLWSALVVLVATSHGTTPINGLQWLLVFLGGLLIFLIVEVEKFFANKLAGY